MWLHQTRGCLLTGWEEGTDREKERERQREQSVLESVTLALTQCHESPRHYSFDHTGALFKVKHTLRLNVGRRAPNQILMFLYKYAHTPTDHKQKVHLYIIHLENLTITRKIIPDKSFLQKLMFFVFLKSRPPSKKTQTLSYRLESRKNRSRRALYLLAS